jgi:L-fuconolactonase
VEGAPGGDRFERWEAWLGKTRETALDPLQRIVDCHHHLWDRGGHRYLPPQMLADAAGLPLASSVYVECQNAYHATGPEHLRPVGETEFVAALREHPEGRGGPDLCAGIIGYADLSLGAQLSEVLDAHVRAGGTRFKGLRYTASWDADPAIHSSRPTRPGMLGEPAVVAAAHRLASRRLTLDVWLYFHQLPDVKYLAKSCPDLSIIVNHCGGILGIGSYAGRRTEVLARWTDSVQRLGALENVALKFGGLAMALAGFPWRKGLAPPHSGELADAWRVYFEVCLQAFGSRRLMFESNFPVDRTGCTYVSLWNAYRRLSESLSASERDGLFAANASRIYALDLPPRPQLTPQLAKS